MTLPGIETALGFVAAFLLVMLCGNRYIDFLRKKYMGQYIREDGPQSHHAKAGTPTAGGMLILAAFLVGLVCTGFYLGSSFFGNPTVLTISAATLIFGILGFTDDYLKIAKKKNKGLSGYAKLFIQIATGLGVGYIAMQHNPSGSVSFFGIASFSLGWLYPVFAALVITAASNAVNLTDGLDGLASGTAILSFMTMAIMLLVLHPDLAIVGHILAGACLGFLMFNHYPARIFMGDTGSLALGGAMGAMAVLGGLEFWLIPIGAVYVLETLSVILQVLSFKTTGKRIFRMSPLHHHFELGGWSENRVVYSFVTFQFLCCAAAVFLSSRG